MRIVSTQSENIKHDILNICELWISSTSAAERVSKLLDLLENASKDISYDTGLGIIGGVICMIKVMKLVMQTEIKVSLMTKTGNISTVLQRRDKHEQRY